MDNKENMHIVTEVGVFGELNVTDPTAKEVNKKTKLEQEELEKLIAESIVNNNNIQE